jgi:hypothetical protein
LKRKEHPMHIFDALLTEDAKYYISTEDELYYMHSSPVIDNDGTIY